MRCVPPVRSHYPHTRLAVIATSTAIQRARRRSLAQVGVVLPAGAGAIPALGDLPSSDASTLWCCIHQALRLPAAHLQRWYGAGRVEGRLLSKMLLCGHAAVAAGAASPRR